MKEQEIWTGETSEMRISLIPGIGSKMISLYNRRTKREWLTDSEEYQAAEYGQSFSASSGSGWDEMLPTINACRYPGLPSSDIELPDHGEVWSLPWTAKAEADGAKLYCEVQGVRLPYRLGKTYSFPEPYRLRIDYTLQNLGSSPMPFLWAAHPLFRVEGGMEIRVPDGLDEIVISYSAGGRLGRYGDRRHWPVPDMTRSAVEQPVAVQPVIRLDRTGCREQGTAEKYYFSGPLREGWAALYDPCSREGVKLVFPVEKVPYLAVWANDGGYEGQYHLALEPATGFLDDLHDAAEQGMSAEVGPGKAYEWFLEVCWH